MPEVQDDDEPLVLRKLKPKILDNDNAHPLAENMMLRKDKGLREWRKMDPYSVRRRTSCDYPFTPVNNKISMRQFCSIRSPL